jgi:aspartyl-tRNA(Asn)/glutamyl-tRNA(Gln) amidotransferase subunit A
VSTYRSLDATDLRASILAGERTAEQATREALAAIAAADNELGAFLYVDNEAALLRARELDAARAAGAEPGPLFGVPVALKSNLCLSGAPASCGSRLLEDYHPPYTATCVQRLIDAGAVPIGMTNMDEFAMGSSSENSAFGDTHNPWDLERTPGGSSSGSVAAVCAGLVPLALGSDTGGSVRQPAALCGVTGFKPTYGAISRYGLVAFGSSLDQVSPCARSVRDLQTALAVLSGHDPKDSTSLQSAPVQPVSARMQGLKVGVPAEFFPGELAGDVRVAVEAALDELVKLGAELIPVELPHTQHALSTYYVVATAEASSNLARYDGVRYGKREAGDGSLQGMIAATRAAGFGQEVKRRILLGTYVLSAGYFEAWYGQALKVRRRITEDFEEAFRQVDVLASPTVPGAAFRLGEKTADPLEMYLSDVFTTPANLAGIPAVSVPCGFVDHEGSRLPVGLQLMAGAGEDAFTLAVAAAFEAATDHRELPPGGQA